MKNKNKLVLILESVAELDQSNLVLEKQDSTAGKTANNNYILEGTFAEFGKANNNNRIYEAEDYKKHLKYLQERIQNGNLFGELDHPLDRFDVSMQSVSHIIKDIKYSPEKNIVEGKIQIVNTTQGKNAKAILDAGGKLCISSRAAGIVNESTRKVQLKKIFTFDIVNTPGFASADLKRISNESLNINDDNVSVFEVDSSFIKNTLDNADDQYLRESLIELLDEVNALNENAEIYNNNNKSTNKKDGMRNMTDKKTSNVSEFVTAKQLQKWSESVKESYDVLENKIKHLETELVKTKKSNNSVSRVNESAVQSDDKTVAYLNYVATNLNNVINYSNYLASGLNKDLTSIQESVSANQATTDKLKGFVDYMASALNETISLVNLNEEERSKMVGYLDYISEELNTSVNHGDHLAVALNKSIGYSNYLAEKLNDSIGHGDHLATTVSDSIGYSNYLAENLDMLSDYANHLAENLNTSIGHGDHLATTVNDLVGYTEYVAENALSAIPGRTNRRVNENETLNSKIDSFLNSTAKRDEFTLNERKLTNLLSPLNYAKYNNLNESDKNKLVAEFSTTRVLSEYDAMKLWENTLYTEKDLKMKVLYEHMPEHIKPLWENLSPERKLQIENRSKYYSITNSLQAKNFWVSQELVEYKTPSQMLRENLNEALSQNTINENVSTGRNYNYEATVNSKDYINKALERFK